MDQGNDFLKDRFIERVILLALLASLVFVCIQIVRPFIGPILWGIIIAVAIWHPYRRLSSYLGDRRVLAAVMVSLGAPGDPGRADLAARGIRWPRVSGASQD